MEKEKYTRFVLTMVCVWHILRGKDTAAVFVYIWEKFWKNWKRVRR